MIEIGPPTKSLVIACLNQRGFVISRERIVEYRGEGYDMDEGGYRRVRKV